MSDTHLSYAQYQTYHARKAVAHQYWSLLMRVRKMLSPMIEHSTHIRNLDSTCRILKRMRNGKFRKNDFTMIVQLLQNSPAYDGLVMHRPENEKKALQKLLASRQNLIELCSE